MQAIAVVCNFFFLSLVPCMYDAGDQMVFFLLNAIELLGLVLTFKPFMAAPESRAA
jgi:hypothetical protein